jgi:lipopolysaccharide assembly outer membrane protein LptD (OstA)
VKKIFLFTLVFLLGAFLFGLIIKKIDYGRVKSVNISGSKVYNFALIKKNHSKIYFEGNKAIEMGKKIKVFGLNGYIKQKQKKTYMSAKNAVLYKDDKSIFLYENVNISSNGVNLNTSSLNIDLSKQVAYGNEFCTITTKNSITNGKNIFINFKDDFFTLKKVKTIIKR